MALPNSIESNSRLGGPTHLARRPLAGAVFGFQFMERLTDSLLAHQGRGVCPSASLPSQWLRWSMLAMRAFTAKPKRQRLGFQIEIKENETPGGEHCLDPPGAELLAWF